MSQPTLRLSVAKASSGSVLLVHDERSAEALVTPLVDAGYRVVVAPNTKAGLEEAMTGAFDVVLCDADIPGGAVVDTLSIIQAYEKKLPLVLLGEDAPASTAHSLETLNLLERLAKPIVAKRLLDVVDRAIEQTRDLRGVGLRTDLRLKDVTPFATRTTAPALSKPAVAPSIVSAAVTSSPAASGPAISTPIISTPPAVSGMRPTKKNLAVRASVFPTAPALPRASIFPTAPKLPRASLLPPGSRRSRPPTIVAFKPEPETSLEDILASVRVELEPIMDTNELRVVGHEVRVICSESALAEHALTSPAKVDELFRRRVRELAVRRFTDAGRPKTKLFLDVTTTDLLDTDLFSPEAPLSRIADRVVLQLRGGASLPHGDLGARTSVLRFLGFRIAVADLDGGTARLSLIGDLAPEYLKLDVSLIRNVDSIPAKRRVVEGLTTMCRLLGTTPIAEGVASAEERAMLISIGCSMVQGPLHDELPVPVLAKARRQSQRPRYGERVARAGRG